MSQREASGMGAMKASSGGGAASGSKTLSGKLAQPSSKEQATGSSAQPRAVIPSKARFEQAAPPPSNWSDEKGKKKGEGDRLSASLSSTIRDAKKSRMQSKRATEMGVNRLPNKF